MKKTINCLLCFALLSPALSGCSPAARSARRVPLTPSVEAMLDEVARRPAGDKVAEAVRGGVGDIRRGRFGEAVKKFAAGLRGDPTNASLHFLSALAYHLDSRSGDQGRLELAEAGYTLALRFDPRRQRRFRDARAARLLALPETAATLRAFIQEVRSGRLVLP